jgi:hypothetical protein
MRIEKLFLLAATAVALSSPAFAQSAAPNIRSGDTVTITREGTDVGIARAAPTEAIDITARALRDGTSVAVHGTVAGRNGANLIVSRPDGDVLAKIHATGTPEVMFYARPIARQVNIGDSVTVFGALKKEGPGLAVLTDAVFDDANGTLYFASESDQLNASPFYNPTGYIFNGQALDKRYRVL